MPTKCDECGEEHYAIYITHDYKKLCGGCYDEVRPEIEWDPEDLPRRLRTY